MPQTKPRELKNICRIDQSRRKKVHETHGWQFKVMRGGKQQTKFFADSAFGSREVALLAAQRYRDERLGEIGEYSRHLLTDILPKNNTSGIIGVHRSESIRKNASIEEVWQSSTPTVDGRTRFRAFNISVHGERGALYKAVEERLEAVSDLVNTPQYKLSSQAIANLIETYLNILVYLESADEAEGEYILSVVNSRTISRTEKQEVLATRVGQASFRAKLDRIWGRSCAVTGAGVLLSASHIKPWALANDRERLDPFNGFLLSPVYDKAFDQGLITFDDSGRIVISAQLAPHVRQLALNPAAQIRRLNPISLPYLQFHRENIFKS